MTMLRLNRIYLIAGPFLKSVRELTARERRALLDEMVQIRGLMPLLMKQRNHQRWTRDDKLELKRHLVQLSAVSPYLVLFVMPGGFILLPAVAWWLDRRCGRGLVAALPRP